MDIYTHKEIEKQFIERNKFTISRYYENDGSFINFKKNANLVYFTWIGSEESENELHLEKYEDEDVNDVTYNIITKTDDYNNIFSDLEIEFENERVYWKTEHPINLGDLSDVNKIDILIYYNEEDKVFLFDMIFKYHVEIKKKSFLLFDEGCQLFK